MLARFNRRGRAPARVAAAALLVLAVALTGSVALAQPTAGSDNSVSVSGSAQVALKPDIAYVTLGTTSSDTTAAGARKANDEAMGRVLAAVKALGVEDKDIQTTNYGIYPQYGTTGRTITGYEVNNSVRVTVRDLDKLGNVLTDATNAGANTTGGLSFDVQDREGAYNQALTLAIQDARQRAETLAKSAGATLGGVLSVTENSGYTPYPMYSNWAMADTAAPVSSGSLNVSASVSVTYALN